MPIKKYPSIPVIKVNQWLNEWNKVTFDKALKRSKPAPSFYLFSLNAKDLKALSGIQRRTTASTLRRSEDMGIQRRHDETRSSEIFEFIHNGFPWSELSLAKRESGNFDDLRMPGWLPTAIVVNMLLPGEKRYGKMIHEKDCLVFTDSQKKFISMPQNYSGADWKPSLHPLEVIDGQHRLWAFDEKNVTGEFELPVVAFHGLDISWQAYLFWTINIKPKRINASLAFDLYPLLRTEDWLEKYDGHSIYRETRAQELTENLWAHPMSSWFQRINMLGDPGPRSVSQAAWIRSLMATYVKKSEGRGIQIGGLFGASIGENALPWSRAQQAAFLIMVWQAICEAIKKCKHQWAMSLRGMRVEGKFLDLAFDGPHSLLNTDQGVRGALYITNDFCFSHASDLNLEKWVLPQQKGATEEKQVTEALRSLQKQPVSVFVSKLARDMAEFDWRSSSADNLSETERTSKLVFRGGSGYKELRRQLLIHIQNQKSEFSKTAKKIFSQLGY